MLLSVYSHNKKLSGDRPWPFIGHHIPRFSALLGCLVKLPSILKPCHVLARPMIVIFLNSFDNNIYTSALQILEQRHAGRNYHSKDDSRTLETHARFRYTSLKLVTILSRCARCGWSWRWIILRVWQPRLWWSDWPWVWWSDWQFQSIWQAFWLWRVSAFDPRQDACLRWALTKPACSLLTFVWCAVCRLHVYLLDFASLWKLGSFEVHRIGFQYIVLTNIPGEVAFLFVPIIRFICIEARIYSTK